VNWDWWLTDPAPLHVFSTFGFLAVFLAGSALFGVIPGFVLAVVALFLLARAAARRLRKPR